MTHDAQSNNSDQAAAMGRLAQALEGVYRERYGPVAARYIVECIAEGKDWSDVLPRLDVPPGGDPRTAMAEFVGFNNALADLGEQIRNHD